jgi:hypothetical protein
MGTSAISQILVTTDEQVKASATDPTAGLLDAKVDASTINVVSEQLVRADLTGDVTTSGNAATIPSGTVTTAMRANGTDGEIPTWNTSGVASTIPVGTSGDVLTSAGAGAVPTFQTPSAGVAAIMLFNWYHPLAYDAGQPRGTFNSTSLQPTTGQTYHAHGRRQSGALGSYQDWDDNGGGLNVVARIFKPAGITTANVAGIGWGELTGSQTLNMQLDIGSVNDITSVGSIAQTPTVFTEYTIDISSLADDAWYDLRIRPRWAGSFGNNYQILYMKQFTIMGT